MVFSSTIFLFIFLPVVLAVYFILPWRMRNAWLLAASLVFYAWGELTFTFLLIGSMAANFCLGLLVDRFRGRDACKWVLGGAVALNLALLVVFKYMDFLVGTLNRLLGAIHHAPVHAGRMHLPIGISFFTFHAISYLVDIYRGHARVQRKPLNFALYEALFPQLVAGPIIRYQDIADQIDARRVTLPGFGSGVRRFVTGLAKKILIANVLAVQADQIFAMQPAALTPLVAWMGVIYYTLQIYFDFSGYSDMAIGLGRMFGFEFVENFNYPYISRSVQEFWRRWHISLSTWFRDYLYIPLGGNRVAIWRVYLNLVIVFFLCGLWHGASWTFVIWGLMHGAFLVLERMKWMAWMERLWLPLRHLYTMLVVMVAWVFFRSDNFASAWTYLCAMAGHIPPANAMPYVPVYLNNMTLLALVAGLVGAMPVAPALGRIGAALPEQAIVTIPLSLARAVFLSVLFLLCAVQLAADTYNPFIYFRF